MVGSAVRIKWVAGIWKLSIQRLSFLPSWVSLHLALPSMLPFPHTGQWLPPLYTPHHLPSAHTGELKLIFEDSFLRLTLAILSYSLITPPPSLPVLPRWISLCSFFQQTLPIFCLFHHVLFLCILCLTHKFMSNLMLGIKFSWPFYPHSPWYKADALCRHIYLN